MSKEKKTKDERRGNEDRMKDQKHRRKRITNEIRRRGAQGRGERENEKEE